MEMFEIQVLKHQMQSDHHWFKKKLEILNLTIENEGNIHFYKIKVRTMAPK